MLPWLAIAIGVLVLLAIMTRQNNTWQKEGIFMTLLVTVGLGVLLGWYLDAKIISFTLLIKWGLAAPFYVKLTSFLLLTGVIASIVAMFASARRSGQLAM